MAIRKPLPRKPSPPAGELTVDDWFSMPDDGNQYELLEGVLVLVTPPNRIHQDILLQLAVALREVAERTGAYVGIAPLGVAISSFIGFEPDIVYVSPERTGILTDRGVEGAPDLVVEVLSPGTRAYDRGTKLRQYLEHGVREVWLVDPASRTVAVHSPAAPARVVAFGEPVPSQLVDIGDGGLAAFA